MFVYTVTKKRAIRLALVILAVLVGIAIGIAAIMTAINSSAEETKLPISSVDRGDNKIAVTFDCAWGNSNTDELLKILSDAGAKATFFVTGEFAAAYPEDVKKMASAGHEIANHSDVYPHVKGMNLADLIADTKTAATKITSVAGKAPTLYRSPYGEYDSNAVTTVEGMGYDMILYSVDSMDWKEPDVATITKNVVDNTKSGSIILFHNDLANTTAALPGILTDLKKKGFDFVKVSDLIYHNDYHVDSTGKQIYDVNVESFITYSENKVINDAMSVIQSNLTYDELKNLKNGISGEIALKIAGMLSAEQISALNGMSAEEYLEAYNALMQGASQSAASEGILGSDAATGSDGGSPGGITGDSGNNDAIPGEDPGALGENGDGIFIEEGNEAELVEDDGGMIFEDGDGIILEDDGASAAENPAASNEQADDGAGVPNIPIIPGSGSTDDPAQFGTTKGGKAGS
jgi:polysaccharide deacetylase family sporulation protein PdaB